ncbi:MAG: tetratricopeptide repeat protein [Candidatus Hodarchaeota archaeon]
MNQEDFNELLQKGQHLSFQGQNEEALRIFEDLLQRPIDDEQRVILYYELGWCFMQEGNYSAAETVFQKQHDEAKLQDNKWGLGAAFNGLGLLHLRRGYLKKALEKLESSLRLRIEIDNKKEVVGAYNNISIVYLARGLVSKTLKLLEENLKIEKELNDIPGIHSALLNLGAVARIDDNYEKAEEYFKKVLDEGTEKVYLPTYLLTIHNQALLWKEKENWDETIKWYKKGIKLAQDNNVGGELYLGLLIGMAKVLAKTDPGESIKTLFEAENVARGAKSETGKIDCILGYGDAGKEMKNWKEAHRRYTQGLEQAVDKQYLDGMLTAYINLAELGVLQYKENKDPALLKKLREPLEEMMILVEEEDLFALRVLLLELESYLLLFNKQFDQALDRVNQAQKIVDNAPLDRFKSRIVSYKKTLENRIEVYKTEPEIKEEDIGIMLKVFHECKKYA